MAIPPAVDGPPEGPLYTLHVYSNLVQIPTLVVNVSVKTTLLSREVTYTALKDVQRREFKVSLDSGAPFESTHMRVEGNDPITLSVVLDLSNRPTRNLPSLVAGLDAMVKTQLLPHDHLTIYSLDCQLVSTVRDVPATFPDIADALRLALHSPMAERSPEGMQVRNCRDRLRLWDALATVSRAMADLPGRRVILVLSNGDDRKSVIKWPMLKRYAAGHSIAIFGLEGIPQTAGETFTAKFGTEDPYNGVTQLTGGVIMTSTDPELTDTLANFIAMVRNRYILEFPRPTDGIAGEHNIDVTLKGSSALIRPAGLTVPLPDPALARDPTVLPGTPSPAVFGKRRPVPDRP